MRIYQEEINVSQTSLFKRNFEELSEEIYSYKNELNISLINKVCIVDIDTKSKSIDKKNSAINIRNIELFNLDSLPCKFNKENIEKILADYANSLNKKNDDLPNDTRLNISNALVFVSDDKLNNPVIYVNREENSTKKNLAIYVS